jgi:hypothetical protein
VISRKPFGKNRILFTKCKIPLLGRMHEKLVLPCELILGQGLCMWQRKVFPNAVTMKPMIKRIKFANRGLNRFYGCNCKQTFLNSGGRGHRPEKLPFKKKSLVELTTQNVRIKEPNDALMDKKNFIPQISGPDERGLAK